MDLAILLISPEPWDHLHVSKHHYAIHLAKKGYAVFFLNPPAGREAVSETAYANLRVIDYKGFPKGLRFMPGPLRKYLTKKMFLRLQTLCNCTFAITWSFDNSVFFDFDALPAGVIKISHIVDQNQDFQFKRAASSADICLGVIPKIVAKQKKFNDNSHLVPHAVQTFPAKPPHVELPGKSAIKLIYTGNLLMPYLDWDLFQKIISGADNTDLVFIGTDTPDHATEFFEETRVFHLPAVASHELPAYLQNADLLLLCYQPEYYRQYASPHKMMEYLASGKMVLATWTEEYSGLHEKGLIRMAKNHEEYLESFKEIMQNFKYWNSPEMQHKRRAFTLENTYDKQIERIEQMINDSKV